VDVDFGFPGNWRAFDLRAARKVGRVFLVQNLGCENIISARSLIVVVPPHLLTIAQVERRLHRTLMLAVLAWSERESPIWIVLSPAGFCASETELIV